MDKAGLLGEILEQGKSTLGDTAKSVKGQLRGFGKTAANQISPNLLTTTQDETDEGNLAKKKESKEEAPVENKEETKKQTEEMVKHLYGIEDNKKDRKGKKNEKQKEEKEIGQGKTPEEQAKIQQLRSSLHQEYYQRLTTPPKPREEERPVEKLEKEKKIEQLEEAEKEKKKPPPLVVQRAQQKAEKFPGVSG